MGYSYCVRCDESTSEGYCRSCASRKEDEAAADAARRLAEVVWKWAGIPGQEPTACRTCKATILFLPIHKPHTRHGRGKKTWRWLPIGLDGALHDCEGRFAAAESGETLDEDE